MRVQRNRKKMTLQKFNGKKLPQLVTYAEKKLCISFNVCKSYRGDDIEIFTVCLTRLKSNKLIIKKELVEKYKNTNEDFEQNCYPRTAKSFYRNGYDSINLKK